MALSSTSRPSIRLKASVKIPASFTATGGFGVSKENGIWTLEPQWEDLEQVTTLPSPEDKEIWARDVNTDVYYRLSAQAFIDNLPIGPAGEITVGTTTALAAGSTPTVANSGTATEAILDFGFPRGADAGIKWAYETSTSMAAPATGGMRFNNASLASVTAIAVSATGSGADVSDWVATWDDSTNTVKGHLIIREEAAATVAVFSISAVTDNTTWLQLTVAYVAGSLSLTAADPLYVVPLLTGNKGADGLGTGDVVGPAASVASEIALFDGTTGKLIKRATTTGMLKATSGVLAAATAGTDYMHPGTTSLITKGFTVTPNNLGNITSFTLDPALGNYQFGVNHGAATWTAPTADCAIDVLLTNDGTAGAITFSGFTVSSSIGSPFTTTNGHRFIVSIRRIAGVSTYSNYALQ
jgi:hypothetical protein